MKSFKFLRCLAALTLMLCGLSSRAAEPQPLTIKVMNGDEASGGFAVNSVLVMGEKDAVLVDAQYTLANAHRLVAMILESGKHLTTVYVTHAHPDHYFGLPLLKAAFPQARVVALPEVATDIARESAFKIAYWGKLLGDNGPRSMIEVESLDGHSIDLEGRTLEIIGPVQGDSEHNSMMWIPSIKTLVSGDVLFNHEHPWIGSTKRPEGRRAWLDTLDRIDALKPEVVVAGHTPAGTETEPGAVAFTRTYLEIFERELAAAANGEALIAVMKQKYPDAGLPICIEIGAKVLKDGMVWDGEPTHK